MSLFDKKNCAGGFMDEIRCDEPSYLVWKWRPSGAQPGETLRENAIRWGSSLRVKDGEVAVFVYSQPNGVTQEFFEGPCDLILTTENLPVLARIVGLAYDGGTPFPAEVYFINLAKIIQVKFGVPFFDVYDPRFTDFGVPVAVRGSISFRIADYAEFIRLHRLINFCLDDFQKQIRDAVCRCVKDCIINAPAMYNIPVIQIEGKTAQINDAIEAIVRERLQADFGVLVSSVDLSAIEIDKASEEYRQLMSVTKDVAAAKIHAETDDYVQRLDIQRQEMQYAMHKQTQTSNLTAFQVEAQTEVGVAGASALGQMGAKGAGDLGSGVHPAAMMAGMAIGGAVGQNIAGTMRHIMSDTNQSLSSDATPPPIPSAAYYVAVEGQAAGPFDIAALTKMAASGQFIADSLVWKNGMAQWGKAGMTEELKSLFPNIPPIPVSD